MQGRGVSAPVSYSGMDKLFWVRGTFPAHGGTGLLKVDPHHDHQLLLVLGGELLELVRILSGRLDVVNRAWTHNDDKSVVSAVEDALDRTTALDHGVFVMFLARELLLEADWWHEGVDGEDAGVIWNRQEVRHRTVYVIWLLRATPCSERGFETFGGLHLPFAAIGD